MKSHTNAHTTTPDTMETILEGWEEDWERRPSLLWRIQRTLSSGARRAVEQTLGLNDGYDSEDDEEISEALFEEVRVCVECVCRR